MEKSNAGEQREGSLLLFLLGRGCSSLSGLGLGQSLLEFVHASRRIDELLLPGVERMAGIANAHDNHRLGRAGLNHVAAGATNLRIHIFWMDFFFHKKAVKNSMCRQDDNLFL